ncbi:MAG: hypothetical protein K0Q79_1068 [Flavipsychrobacter sp.]|jgi:hypothetical protein|nr:hypothetical protein [Flavipsychrobacter sp.]
MKYFKVFFENNIPVLAERLPIINPEDIISISEKEGKRYIAWLVVYADNEADAIRESTEILKKYNSFFGLS